MRHIARRYSSVVLYKFMALLLMYNSRYCDYKKVKFYRSNWNDTKQLESAVTAPPLVGCVVWSLLNPDKITSTLFTPDPAEYTSNLVLTINNKALPMATHPKVQGLTLDAKLTYSTQIHNISVQSHQPQQMIKALTTTGWGKQKEALMATYKAVMRPGLEYASSI